MYIKRHTPGSREVMNSEKNPDKRPINEKKRDLFKYAFSLITERQLPPEQKK